ncbi:MAG: hypothetical protein E4H03_02990 [Myxococcales bacterium]|nr:MAG: hypothetical protein E4H03_02990 [Myxococcales bacterium]
MIGTVAVFALAAAYFLLFRTYGFQLEDEGNILFLVDRYMRGQAPYLEFHTGYTPGFFAICATIFRALGEDTGAVRLVLALVNAATSAGLYVLARRGAPWWLALLAPLLWVAFLPVFPGEFASFNVPYPAWFATLGWIGLALALDRWQRGGSLAWPAVAGLAAAFAFSTKVNAGAFAMVGATFVVALTASQRRYSDRAAAIATTVAMTLGTLVAFGGDWRATDGLVHLLPLAALAGLCTGPMAGRMARPNATGALATLTVLYASFTLATLLWAGPLMMELGLRRFLVEVMLLGSGYGHLYYTAHPAPEPYAVVLVLGLVAAAICGRIAGRARLDIRMPIAATAVTVAAAAVFVSRQPMAESFATSLRLQLENAAFWLVPTVNLAGIAWLYRARRRAGDAGAGSSPAVVVPLAVAMYWQLFPRSDFMHVIVSVPLAIVLAVRLANMVLSWWAMAVWPAFLPAAVAVRAMSLGVAGLVSALMLPSSTVGALECVANRKAQLQVSRARICLETGATDEMEEMAATAAYLRRVSRPDEPVLAFPALAAILFAGALTSPVPHDYWYPGRPGHDEEHEMVSTLAADPPRHVVTLNDGWTFFHGAPAYYSELRRFIVDRYRLVGRFGRYDVLALDTEASGRVVGTGPVRQANASDVIEPSFARRRQAARRRMRSLTLQEAHRPELAPGTSAAVLQLRAIRDGGDLRTAGWILQGFDGGDARVVSAAVEAMDAVVRRFGAARFRWANDLEPSDYAPYVSPWGGEIARLTAAGDARVRLFGEALALVLGVGDAPADVDSEGDT